MAVSVKCGACGKVDSLPSSYDAAQAGWRFATVSGPGFVKHFVWCPGERLPWLDTLLGIKPKKEKE